MPSKLVASLVVICAFAWAPPAFAQALPPAGPACDGSQGQWAGKVMLFTEGSGAPAGAIDGVCAAAASEQIAVDLATGSDAFSAQDIGAYGAVVFLDNSGDVLSDAEQQVLQDFVAGGKGYAGIHAAAGAEAGI